MSIARDLEKNIVRLRLLHKRSFAEIIESAPALLEEQESILERVRGLEKVAPIQVLYKEGAGYGTQ